MYNVKDIIQQEASGETFMLSSVSDNEAENRINNMISSMDESYYNIPFVADAVHLFKIDENYVVTYSDMMKFCKTMNIDTFIEAVSILAEHYKISKDNIVVAIEEVNGGDVSDMSTIADRLREASDCGIRVRHYDCWGSDDIDINLELMYGAEDAKLIDDDEWDDDEDELITERDPITAACKSKKNSKKCIQDACGSKDYKDEGCCKSKKNCEDEACGSKKYKDEGCCKSKKNCEDESCCKSRKDYKNEACGSNKYKDEGCCKSKKNCEDEACGSKKYKDEGCGSKKSCEDEACGSKKYKDEGCCKSKKKSIKESILSVNSDDIRYNIDMVNVYQEEDNYYIEMSDIEKYMYAENIDSIKEAVCNIASHNDFDWKNSIILCEACDKIKKKKSNRCKSEGCRSKKKTMNKIAKTFDENVLRLGWVSND